MAVNTDMRLKNQLIYQIFVRNFSEEGTFRAVIPELSRIKALGTDIIWLMPIQPSGEKNRKGSLGSPYAIRDYRAINPEFGTLDDFKELVSAIHAHGMKCIIDVVYNHTSPDSVLSKEHPEWFYHKADGSFGNHVGDWSDVIDLEYEGNPELWDYQIETLKMWARICDGFRCDVASLVPAEFWERARAEVETVRPGCIWLAESVHASFIAAMRREGLTAHSDCELYRAFDICYDYDIIEKYDDYMSGRGTLERYLEAVNSQEYIYPANYIKLRFLENHDQPRARFRVPDGRALRNFTAFSFFQKGTALVYAGQEAGVRHLPGLFDKDTVDWNSPENIDLSGFIARLAKIKKAGIFAGSSYHVEKIAENVIFAEHRMGVRGAYGIFFLKGQPCSVKVGIPDGRYVNEITGEKVDVLQGLVSSSGEPIEIIL